MNQIKRITYPYPNIVLIGRPNVGKSSLFNKFTEKQTALISTIPGTTRDKNIGVCIWDNYLFKFIDTAGIEIKNQKKLNELQRNIYKQTENAINQADVILFVVDIHDGILPDDKKIIQKIKKACKPFILLINKSEKKSAEILKHEFCELGAPLAFSTSAITGKNLGEVLDAIINILKDKNIKTKINYKIDIIISIVGKPNTGKSSLLNALLKEELSLVSETPFTTRDPKNILTIFNNKNILFVDTAGIRKQQKKSHIIERHAIQKGLGFIKKSDISLFVIDVSKPLTFQDKKIAGQLISPYTSIITVGNKMDKLNQKEKYNIKNKIKTQLPSLKNYPIVLLSAKYKKGIKNLINIIMETYNQRNNKMDQELLDNIIVKIVKQLKNYDIPYFYKLKQTDTNPPEFTLIVDKKEKMPTGLTNNIKNKLITSLKLNKTPVEINIKKI
jgi:GTP-binding protein